MPKFRLFYRLGNNIFLYILFDACGYQNLGYSID